MLALGCLDGILKFYTLTGQQKSKDRDLGFDPLSLTYFSSGEYIAISGIDRGAGWCDWFRMGALTWDGNGLTRVEEQVSDLQRFTAWPKGVTGPRTACW